MNILLTNVSTLTTIPNGFAISVLIKKDADQPLELHFNEAVINQIDTRYEDFCIVAFTDNTGKHVLVVTDYEEPLLDGDLMFI